MTAAASAADPDPGAALELAGMSRRFGQTLALDGTDLHVRTGTVHALLGENGAGKTTLMRIAYGMVRPDSGTMTVNGKRFAPSTAADAIRAGLGMVHQHFTNVPAMTVAENVALGNSGVYNSRRAAQRVTDIGERTGLLLDPWARAADLPVGAQQRLEIVKALARDARVLILDEPTAVLAPAEARELLTWIRRFADNGRTVILITHKLTEALEVADEVTVLRRGRNVLTGAATDLTTGQLAHAMLGEDLVTSTTINRSTPGDVRIRAEHVYIEDVRGRAQISDATFVARAGEITGIAGVEGAGQAALLRALAGRRNITRGSLDLPDSIGFIPEDRHRDALILGFSLTENVALRGAGARSGRMNWRHFADVTQRLKVDFDVRAPSARAHAGTLSGGNQQKLVLARELAGPPGAVIAENPTRGLDVRAAASVGARLRAAAAAGAAVVVHSADLDEVIALSSRLLVVFAGRVIEVPVDREIAGRAMLGLV